MKHHFSLIFVLLLSLIMFAQNITAHVPIGGEPGDTIDTALEIKNPLKSWVLYHKIHEVGEPHYYRFQMEAEDRLRLILNIPAELEDSAFRPILVLIGPGLINSTTAPDYLEIPIGSGYIIYDNQTSHPEYEGFTPSAFLKILDIDITIPETETYYLAIYDMMKTERYALAIGFQEVFTLEEWILVPINIIFIHQWEGQNIFFILAPWIFTLFLGIIFYSRKVRELEIDNDALTWMGIIAGLLFIGSGFALIFQMVWALLQVPINVQVIITILFALFPLLIGITTLKILKKGWKDNKNSPFKLILLAGFAVFTWSGLLIGPGLLLLVSLIRFIDIGL